MELSARLRKRSGKQNKSLRREGLLPSVVFGKDISPLNISVNQNDFVKVFKETGESTLIDLKIAEDEPIKVLISEVQRNPITNSPIHANFQKVDLKEKVTAEIPIKVVGTSEFIESGEGILLNLINEVEVECLPMDLPKELTIDISNLNNIGDSLQVKDIKIDQEKIEFKVDPEELVCKIDYAEQIEEEEEEVSEEELIEGVEATEELSDEERQRRDAEKSEAQKDKEEVKEEEDKGKKEK